MRRSDTIRLAGVTAYGYHGVLAHERRDGQDFVVDLELELDLRPAGQRDELGATVSYAEVAADVVAAIEGEALDLIESLAERIATGVLARPVVEAVSVTVHKPQAPVGVVFGDVSVTVHRERDVPVVVALGANLEDPAAAVRAAGHRLRRLRGVRGVRMSPLFATAPVGGPAQPDYVNAVALASTRLTPAALLQALHRIEDDFGRTRETRWGARTLDLDLVQVGDPALGTDVRCADPALMLPHPRARERGFVLAPWHAVDPTATLRVGEEAVPIEELLARVDLAGVRRWEEQ